MAARLIIYPVFIILISLFFKEQWVFAFFDNNGFDLSNSLIDKNEIHYGGPAKDGIPAIDHPLFVTAQQADYLSADEQILGLSIDGEAKAYPLRILNYHEIVNDFFDKKPVVISYCPLCGSGMAYSAVIRGIHTTFGVSGLLYNSDVLLYDRETNSLWSQLMSQAISGPLQGEKLQMLVLTHTRWQDWRKRYPDTLVLSDKTGFSRDYTRSPYGNYNKQKSLYFPVKSLNNDYHPKEYVIGLNYKGVKKAYPFVELSKIDSPYKDKIANETVLIVFDAQHRTGRILDAQGEEIPTVTSFWFAWMAFYPHSEIFKAHP